jgi:hypothetical protein
LRAKSAAVAKTYSLQNKYEPGDVLEHPTFGRGVTTAVKDGKIEVLFESGSKMLVHGRPVGGEFLNCPKLQGF